MTRRAELPPDLKIGDRVPMPPREVKVRPAYVDKLQPTAFGKGRNKR